MSTRTTALQATHAPLTQAWTPGAIGGVIGGMAMAMFSMLVAISEDGFWAPVRGIASVGFGDEHYGGGFEFWPVVVGAMGHMMNAAVLGAVFALVVVVLLSRAGSMAVWMAGAVYGLGVWAVMVLGVAPALQDSELFADAVPQWAWVVSHLMFGLVTAMVVTGLRRDRR
jgi:hypothetical protein